MASFPGWLQPAGEGVNYLLVVWHAITLGLLLGSLFLVAGGRLIKKLHGRGFGAHIIGSTISLAQPFCSCCAAPIGSTLYRKGASLGPMLAFVVSSPMLNVTSLVLAAALLPPRYAILRIAGGLITGVFLTYGVSRIASRWVSGDDKGERGRLFRLSDRIFSAYNRLFHLERLIQQDALDSPATLISSWWRTALRLARIMIPVFLIGSVLSVYVVSVMPETGNNLTGIIVTSFFATLLMVPTWTEIPFTAALVSEGLTGIASVALIALPAVSLPCLLIIAGTIKSFKTAALLGGGVFLTGILAGIIFL